MRLACVCVSASNETPLGNISRTISWLRSSCDFWFEFMGSQKKTHVLRIFSLVNSMPEGLENSVPQSVRIT